MFINNRLVQFLFPHLFLIVIILFFSGCGKAGKKPCYTPLISKAPVVREAHFTQVSYRELHAWQSDNHLEALNAFLNSCNAINNIQDNHPISKNTKLGGKAKEWKKVCKIAKSIKNPNKAREFFEQWFNVYLVTNNNNSPLGKFTGYYEVELDGSLIPSKRYRFPVYAPPSNIKSLKGTSSLSRNSINNGYLRGKNLEIAWVDNEARLFFMHIQGSGVIKLAEGGELKLSFAEQNGFSYKAIGPSFKKYGACNLYSALDMMNWLHANPVIGSKIMAENQSYIFFKKRPGNSTPIGAQGVPLESERSIAIDSGIYPYGAPIWVETSLPNTKNYKSIPYHHLFIAQDRGGAIKGGIRADIFFGRNKRAEEIACYMNQEGRYYILFPKSIHVPKFYKVG